MAKSKRDEKADEKEGDYEFKLPAFDDRAFIRREVLTARASFVMVGLGIAAGVVAGLVWYVLPRPDAGSRWMLAWIPLVLSLFVLRPLLVRMKFPEDVTKMRALWGSYFMVFFTGLAVWILVLNVLP
jgi:hypothetical protein